MGKIQLISLLCLLVAAVSCSGNNNDDEQQQTKDEKNISLSGDIFVQSQGEKSPMPGIPVYLLDEGFEDRQEGIRNAIDARKEKVLAAREELRRLLADITRVNDLGHAYRRQFQVHESALKRVRQAQQEWNNHESAHQHFATIKSRFLKIKHDQFPTQDPLTGEQFVLRYHGGARISSLDYLDQRIGMYRRSLSQRKAEYEKERHAFEREDAKLKKIDQERSPYQRGAMIASFVDRFCDVRYQKEAIVEDTFTLLELMTENSSFVAKVDADDRGHFQFKNLKPGDYTLAVFYDDAADSARTDEGDFRAYWMERVTLEKGRQLNKQFTNFNAEYFWKTTADEVENDPEHMSRAKLETWLEFYLPMTSDDESIFLDNLALAGLTNPVSVEKRMTRYINLHRYIHSTLDDYYREEQDEMSIAAEKLLHRIVENLGRQQQATTPQSVSN